MLTVYSKKGCTYCDKLVQFLHQKGLDYTKLTLGEDYTSEQFLDKFGRGTFPRVLHDDKLIGGTRETVNYLVKNKLV